MRRPPLLSRSSTAKVLFAAGHLIETDSRLMTGLQSPCLFHPAQSTTLPGLTCCLWICPNIADRPEALWLCRAAIYRPAMPRGISSLVISRASHFELERPPSRQWQARLANGRDLGLGGSLFGPSSVIVDAIPAPFNVRLGQEGKGSKASGLLTGRLALVKHASGSPS